MHDEPAAQTHKAFAFLIVHGGFLPSFATMKIGIRESPEICTNLRKYELIIVEKITGLIYGHRDRTE